MAIEYSVLRLTFCPVGNRMNHMGIQTDNHPEISFIVFVSSSRSKSLIFLSGYLTRTLMILFFERAHTWLFTRLIIFAINDALAQIDTFVLHTLLQIIFILRWRIFTTDTNRIGTTIASIWTISVAWTIIETTIENPSAFIETAGILARVSTSDVIHIAFFFTFCSYIFVAENLILQNQWSNA